MSRKSREKKKAQKAQQAWRNAHDIQTPAPTEVGSEPESQQAESSREQESRPKASRDTRDKTSGKRTRSESQQVESSRGQESRPKASRDIKGKAPERRTRFDRSPTRKGDFAPNASDYESNAETNLDLSDASNQAAPIEHKPQPLSRWVRDIIRNETMKESERMVEEFFTSNTPQYERCQEFFQRLNQHIRGVNSQNDVTDIDTGIIPETGYNALCQAWQQAAKKAVENKSPEQFWEAFNKTRDLLRAFNKRYYLPKVWNLSEAWAEQRIGTRNPKMEEDTSYTSESGDIQSTDQLSADGEANAESVIESDIEIDNNQPTGLDALETRTIKQQRQLNSAKVLYWWPKGTGSQIFVRYGNRPTPIYRIRAGSYESYNPSRVERVLTTLTRGTAKVIVIKNGLPEEFWKYKRKDVEDLIGIGWKVEEDDEQGFDPLNLLLPAKGITYPQTRILVKWKDGLFTLEGRSFIRRITSGSALDGDRVIYQKAEELETSYRKKHGLYDIEDDDVYTESDRSVQSNKAYDRRHNSEPAHYSNPRSRRTTTRLEDSSDEENDKSTQSRQNRDKRYRSEPAHYSNPRIRRTTTHLEDSTDEDSDVNRDAPAGRRPRKVQWIRRYRTDRRGSTV